MAVANYTTEYVDLGDCRIALYDIRRARSLTVVFVHGIGGAKTVWTPVIERLPAEWRLLAYDYRGGGESEEAEARQLSLDLWAADLKALLEARQVETPVLVGHSLGASIALQFALNWPEIPAALCLVGAEAGLCRLGAVMQARAQAIFDSGVDGWVRGPWRQAPPFSQASRAADPDMVDEYAKMLYQTGAERYVRAVAAIAESPDLTDSLQAIGQPSLVVIGGDDDRTTPEVGWKLANGLPNGRGVELPGVGHTISYEAPQAVADELVQFVGACSLES